MAAKRKTNRAFTSGLRPEQAEVWSLKKCTYVINNFQLNVFESFCLILKQLYCLMQCYVPCEFQINKHVREKNLTLWIVGIKHETYLFYGAKIFNMNIVEVFAQKIGQLWNENEVCKNIEWAEHLKMMPIAPQRFSRKRFVLHREGQIIIFANNYVLFILARV